MDGLNLKHLGVFLRQLYSKVLVCIRINYYNYSRCFLKRQVFSLNQCSNSLEVVQNTLYSVLFTLATPLNIT